MWIPVCLINWWDLGSVNPNLDPSSRIRSYRLSSKCVAPIRASDASCAKLPERSGPPAFRRSGVSFAAVLLVLAVPTLSKRGLVSAAIDNLVADLNKQITEKRGNREICRLW